MPSYKRIDGDYTISTVNAGDRVIINATTDINGNLNVTGNITYIDVTDLKVSDPFITVAGNNQGTIGNALFESQGLVAQTSSNTYAGLRFNNTANTWEISSSVASTGAPLAAYQPLALASSSVPGAPENAIQFNVGNVFTGSANLVFDSANAKITLQGHEVFGNIGTAPSAVANSVALYHNAVGSGGTGLYIKTPAVEDELVSKTKAIVFGIIF